MTIHTRVAERQTERQTRSRSSGGASGEVPAPLETSTDTLTERVDKRIQAGKVPLEWGSPLLSTTPTSLAVHQLAAQTEALEKAVREIAREVQKLSADG